MFQRLKGLLNAPAPAPRNPDVIEALRELGCHVAAAPVAPGPTPRRRRDDHDEHCSAEDFGLAARCQP